LIVRCENCRTEFALDDAQVGPEGVTVRCSVCAYVFRVRPKPGSAGDQPWQIQTTDDLLFTAPDLATLRAWIEEGRLHPEDKVSRTGNHWLSLGEMPEFSPLFPGYQGLPKVFQAVAAGPKKPDAERSAAEELGPPPAFGGEGRVELRGRADEVGRGQGSSPLEIASRHAVRPITGAGLDAAAAAARARPAEGSDAEPDEAASSRTSAWMFWAALGMASAVALAFGIPQTRALILGEPEPEPTVEAQVPPPPAEMPPELSRAAQALETLGVADVSRAEAAIQRAIDAGTATGPALARLQLAQADLLVSRALVYTVAAAIDRDAHDRLIKKADDDLDRANRIFDKMGSAPDGDRVSLVRARIRLAEGRDSAEIVALLPEHGAEEMQLAVEAAALWHDPSAKVPGSIIGRLQQLERRSGLGSSVLALALLRSGDAAGAGTVADELLGRADDHPVGLAIRRPGTAAGATPVEPPSETVEAAGETGEAAVEEPPVAASTGTGGKVVPTPVAGGGQSFEKLLERGCADVDSGKASAGVASLLKAFDRNPADLDVLVCLGKGYEALGNGQRALHFYDKALSQSPRHRSALRGAAMVAESMGSDRQALGYYKRLLQVDPMNARARVFVQQHEGGGGEAPPEDPAPPAGETG
jgi:predicted Zn finger-like uncharacterized protein